MFFTRFRGCFDKLEQTTMSAIFYKDKKAKHYGKITRGSKEALDHTHRPSYSEIAVEKRLKVKI